MNGRQAVGSVLIVAGVAAGVLWASGHVRHPFAPVVALFLFLVGASFFRKVSADVEKMRSLVGKNVEVWVWGSELPGHADSKFRVHTVQAIGPGLQVYLRSSAGGSPTQLKIA